MEICRRVLARPSPAATPLIRRRMKKATAASAAHAEALRYMRMTAKLGLALAKLKGEHTSNIRIHKTETVKPPPSVERPPGRPCAPSPERFHEAWKKFTRETFGWDWQDDGGADGPGGQGAGDPLPVFAGSNTPPPDPFRARPSHETRNYAEGPALRSP